ncbi:MAG: tRNA pseudouridine(38-40) synthase TruA [Nitrospiraceae bacterium]|nr:MAG: tRNA pseudouridine(38-40) synthase TruA [Nitrospiraceae bacterium]
MRHIKLALQYDGSGYSGWQIQAKGATVQGLLEEALFAVTGERTRVTGAARTDAGVHALEQVAAFNTGALLGPQIYVRALNAGLPDDIRVISAEECDAGFHPRYDARNKTYSYLISFHGNYSAFLKRYSWSMPYKLNIDAMREAAQCLAGTHDFASFRASGCSSKHPVRTIHGIEIAGSASIEFIGLQFHAPVIRIGIQANAFLRHMVRNIVGTLVEIGRGRSSPESMKEILESRDRKTAGRTAPACGLFLEKITY